MANTSLAYAFFNISANALAQSGPFRPTQLYARFASVANSNGQLSPPGGDIQAANRSTFIAPTDGSCGGLWVPILSAPVQSTTNTALYNGNQLTFLFRIPYNIPASQQSPAVFNAATSYIYALGLAVQPNLQDPTQDIIIATQQNPGDFTAFQIPNSGQITVDFVLPFSVLPP